MNMWKKQQLFAQARSVVEISSDHEVEAKMTTVKLCPSSVQNTTFFKADSGAQCVISAAVAGQVTAPYTVNTIKKKRMPHNRVIRPFVCRAPGWFAAYRRLFQFQ